MEIENEDHSLQMSLGKKNQLETESSSMKRSSMIALGLMFV